MGVWGSGDLGNENMGDLYEARRVNKCMMGTRYGLQGVGNFVVALGFNGKIGCGSFG